MARKAQERSSVVALLWGRASPTPQQHWQLWAAFTRF
jgi:hypothetical protein